MSRTNPIWRYVMKKSSLVALSIVAFIMTTSFCSCSRANPVGIVASTPRISVISPNEEVYGQNSVSLSFSGQAVTWLSVEYSNVKYWLDGNLRGQIDSLEESKTFSTELSGLADGVHYIEVTAVVIELQRAYPYVEVPWGPSLFITSEKMSFTVDTTKPQITILPLSINYFEDRGIVNFTVNEPVVWVSYSLNENNNATITDTILTRSYGQYNYQFAISNLTEGANSLTVYAKDAAGNEASSKIVYFTHSSISPSLSPKPSLNLTEVPTSSPSNYLDTQTTSAEQSTPLSPQTDEQATNEVNTETYFLIIGLFSIIAVSIMMGASVYLKMRNNKK